LGHFGSHEGAFTVSLKLFEAFGVELEYMLVDAATLDVAPVADRVIRARCGAFSGEIEADRGISWSNELVSHVLELKTTDPTPSLETCAADFTANVTAINDLAARLPRSGGSGGPTRLMPGAMHPWMDPPSQTVLWPHEYAEVYANFHRLFDCHRHGWANLQSVHLNLPFDGDEEFGRLHAAVRLVLPLLPALCASSPLMDGQLTGIACNRLEVYRNNQRAVPSLSGRVVPEPVFSRADYERVILEPIARDVERLDPGGTMKAEWMNSRGAIARFDRGSIEIRVMDIQECPLADLAIVRAVVGVLRWIVSESPCPLAEHQRWPVDPLVRVLDATIRDGDRAVIDDVEYLRVFGITGGSHCRASEVWEHLLDAAGVAFRTDPSLSPLKTILGLGTLSRRLSDALGAGSGPVDRAAMRTVYRDLCDCLAAGRMYGEAAH